MLDLIGLIYITLSTLYLLGIFPIGLYEFLDFREGYAISDYGYLFETGTYFSMSAVIAGLLCGLDAITEPVYKRVNRLLYNYHAFTSFTLIGIGLFPLTGEFGWPSSRVLHWISALCFLYIYPITRLLILKEYDKKIFNKVASIFLSLNIIALLLLPVFGLKEIASIEYFIWAALLITIVLSKVTLSKKAKNPL